MSVGIDEFRNHVGQHVRRIGHRTAVKSGVQVLVGAGHLHLHVAESAQAAGDGRGIPCDETRIGNEDDVGFHQLPVFLAPFVKASGAYLLFPFEHELHIARQLPRSHERLERLGVHVELPLVVVGTAAPDAPFLHDRLERLRPPLVHRVFGHHVIVAVHEHRRQRPVDDFFREDHRIALGRHHLGPVGARLEQRIPQPLRRTHHIPLMNALGADRGYPEQLKQLLHEPFPVLFDILFYHIN